MNGVLEGQNTYLFQFSEGATGQRKRPHRSQLSPCPYIFLMHSYVEVVLCNAVFLIIL